SGARSLLEDALDRRRPSAKRSQSLTLAWLAETLYQQGDARARERLDQALAFPTPRPGDLGRMKLLSGRMLDDAADHVAAQADYARAAELLRRGHLDDAALVADSLLALSLGKAGPLSLPGSVYAADRIDAGIALGRARAALSLPDAAAVVEKAHSEA